MIISHTTISAIMILISLYLFPGTLQAQTASSRPISEAISERTQGVLDQKTPSPPVSNPVAMAKLPSANEIPEKAKPKNGINSPSNSNKPVVLPSNAAVDVAAIRRRNEDVQKKIKSGQH